MPNNSESDTIWGVPLQIGWRKRFWSLSNEHNMQSSRVPGVGFGPAQEPVTRPVVSEEACPLESIAPVSKEGHRGEGLLRKSPGAGPFPAVVCLHGGLTRQSSRELLQLARS